MDASRLDDPNLAMLEIVVQALGTVCDSLVFVGGCATGPCITDQLRSLLATSEFLDALPGHLPGDQVSQARLPELIRRLRQLAQ